MSEYDHIPGLQEQLKREVRSLPTIEIDPSIKDLDDIEPLLSLETDEIMSLFQLHNYNPHSPLKFKVAV